MLTLQTRRYSVMYPRLAPRLLLRPETLTPAALMRTIPPPSPPRTSLESPFTTHSRNHSTTVSSPILLLAPSRRQQPITPCVRFFALERPPPPAHRSRLKCQVDHGVRKCMSSAYERCKRRKSGKEPCLRGGHLSPTR